MTTKALKTKEKKTLLNIIKEESENGKTTIEFNDLKRVLPFSRNNSETEVELFNLMQNGKILILSSKRNPDELQIKYLEKATKSESFSKIINCIDSFLLFFRLFKKLDRHDFERITNGRFSKLNLMKIIEKHDLKRIEIKILVKTIKGYINGMSPIHLSDMSLLPSEFLIASKEIITEKHKLIKNKLLAYRIDVDGISISTMLTRETLDNLILIDSTKSLEPKRQQHHLYELIPYSSIPSKKVLYSENISEFFQDITEITKFSKKDDNISLLLYGPSGTGKTEFAYQLALNTNSDIMQMDFPQITSKWIGETEKNIKQVFAKYAEHLKRSERKIILLINEADGLMNKRVGIIQSNDIHANQNQTQMLERLEAFKGIVIATTNIFQNIDEAFHRRFLFKQKIDFPTSSIKLKAIKDSIIINFIEESLLKSIVDSTWSIAQLRNCENKIAMISKIREVNGNSVINILKEEGLIEDRKRIGY
jgi:hypothetical protein